MESVSEPIVITQHITGSGIVDDLLNRIAERLVLAKQSAQRRLLQNAVVTQPPVASSKSDRGICDPCFMSP